MAEVGSKIYSKHTSPRVVSFFPPRKSFTAEQRMIWLRKKMSCYIKKAWMDIITNRKCWLIDWLNKKNNGLYMKLKIDNISWRECRACLLVDIEAEIE